MAGILNLSETGLGFLPLPSGSDYLSICRFICQSVSLFISLYISICLSISVYSFYIWTQTKRTRSPPFHVPFPKPLSLSLPPALPLLISPAHTLSNLSLSSHIISPFLRPAIIIFPSSPLSPHRLPIRSLCLEPVSVSFRTTANRTGRAASVLYYSHNSCPAVYVTSHSLCNVYAEFMAP